MSVVCGLLVCVRQVTKRPSILIAFKTQSFNKTVAFMLFADFFLWFFNSIQCRQFFLIEGWQKVWEYCTGSKKSLPISTDLVQTTIPIAHLCDKSTKNIKCLWNAANCYKITKHIKYKCRSNSFKVMIITGRKTLSLTKAVKTYGVETWRERKWRSVYWPYYKLW